MTGDGERQQADKAGPVRFDDTGSYERCADSISVAATR